ncbi:MAG: hypothetical protein ACRCYU_18480 [Nocardioides sp.]
MGKGFEINRRAIQKMSKEIEKEFARNPVRVPLEADASGVTFPAAAVTNNYHGPVVTVHGDNVQLAWDNQTVNQTQNQDIAPGYEELAKVVTGLLVSLPALGLSDADEQEAKATATTVLGEVVKDEPDQGRIKRSITMLRGLLAPIATGVRTAASDESAELSTRLIDGLGSTLPF